MNSFLANTPANFVKNVLLPIVLFFPIFSVFSNSPLLRLTSENNSYNPALHFFYLVDDTQLLDIDDILSEAYQSEFYPLYQEKPNFGFSRSNYWFKLRVINKDSLHHRWVFEVPYPPLDSLSFWIFKENKLIKHYHLGDQMPFDKRPILHPHFIIPIELSNDGIYEIYIRLKTESSVILPITLKHEELFFTKEIGADIGYGIFYGALMFIIIYNLFIYLVLKDKSYLFYVAATVSSTLFIASLVGHSFQYIWGDFPWWANKALPFFIGAWGTFSAFFAREFLEIRQNHAIINNLLKFNIFSGYGIMALAFLVPYYIITPLAAIVITIDVVIMVLAGVYAWKAQNRSAQYYLLAWSMLLLATFILALRNFGILPYTLFTTHAVEIGSLLEALLLSLALSDKYRIMREEKEKMQIHALEMEKKHAQELEEKIKARTLELEQQKKATEEEHALVSAKNVELEAALKEIAKKNEKIQSSIRYAQRIQQSILPFHHHFASAFQDYFIFYKSKEPVSGDFYWIHHRREFVLTAAVDCTGHGIPGAFMSMVGYTLLEQIVGKKQEFVAANILNELHEGVRSTLQQASGDNRDGMDIALCVINRITKELQFAGARNPLYYIKDQVIHTIEGDKMHIGGLQLEEERIFTNHVLTNIEDIRFYLCTDGYEDQFGEEAKTKFYRKRLKELFLKIHQLPMRQQRTELRETLHRWIGKEKQTDDILVMGFIV